MAQNTVLEALARVAATLREAELRTLLHLLACVGEGGTCRVSSRQIAEATGQGRKTVQVALDGLQERGLVESDGGSATRAAMLTLRFLRTVPLVRGVAATPPPQDICGKDGGQVALFQRHPGVAGTPPLALQERHPGVVGTPLLKESSRVGAPAFEDSIDSSEFDRSIARLLKAGAAKYDPGRMAEARKWLHGYMAKFGQLPDPHPPDDLVCAQFLACGEWPRLEGMLYDLMAERRRPGYSYAWFVTVAMQRLWGVSPQKLKEARRQFALLKGGKNAGAAVEQVSERAAAAAAGAACAAEVVDSEAAAKRALAIEQLRAQVRGAAAGKAMR